jgi:AraC-like DNA-binding protein
MGDRISTVMGRFGRFSICASMRSVNPHTYKELSALFHLGGPQVVIKTDEVCYPLREGEMLLLDPWRSHARLARATEPTCIATLLIDQRWLHDCDDVDGPMRGGSYFRHSYMPIGELSAPLQNLQELMFDQPTTRTALIQENLLSFIRMLMLEHGSVMEKSALRQTASIDLRVRYAFDHLRQSALRGVKIENLVAGSGMSRSHFFRQFKRSIGVSPQHVIDEERIAHALRALSAPGVMMSQVANELGFSRASHFTRFFVQHLGCTPNQFRRNLVLV